MSPFEKLVASAELLPVMVDSSDNPDNLPFVTHEGTLDLGGVQIKVVQLNTGQRLVAGDVVEKLMGFIKP